MSDFIPVVILPWGPSTNDHIRMVYVYFDVRENDQRMLLNGEEIADARKSLADELVGEGSHIELLSWSVEVIAFES